MALLQGCQLKYQIVITKCDKVNQASLDETVHQVLKEIATGGHLTCDHQVLGVTTRGEYETSSIDRFRAELLHHTGMSCLLAWMFLLGNRSCGGQSLCAYSDPSIVICQFKILFQTRGIPNGSSPKDVWRLSR